jgi:hypothetical protein
MSFPWRSAAETLIADLRNIFADRLLSVVVYGPHVDGSGGETPVTCLALVRSLTADDLDGCARASHRWDRNGLSTPLILPVEEFRRSLDAFPLEYGEIIRAHERVFGPDPFDGMTIVASDLRRACETQVKSHLLHLREGYIEAGGDPQRIAGLVRASAPGFTALLRNVARLHDVTNGDRAAVARQGATIAGLSEGVVADIITLEQSQELMVSDPARLFPHYLTAVEQLARFVDSWRGQTS